MVEKCGFESHLTLHFQLTRVIKMIQDIGLDILGALGLIVCGVIAIGLIMLCIAFPWILGIIGALVVNAVMEERESLVLNI